MNIYSSSESIRLFLHCDVKRRFKDKVGSLHPPATLGMVNSAVGCDQNTVLCLKSTKLTLVDWKVVHLGPG